MIDYGDHVGPAAGDTWQLRPRALVITGHARTPPALARAAHDLGVDIIVRGHDDADRLHHGAVDLAALVWVELNDSLDDALTRALQAAVEEDGLPLVVQLNDAVMDAAWAAFGGSDGVSFVSGDDVGDATVALAGALAARRPALASAVWDTSRDRQLERLQEEVQRIAVVLARLSGTGGDFEPGLLGGPGVPSSPFIEDHVASDPRAYRPQPGSGFGAAPPPRLSAMAARVRGMIRERRARELVFAPELFADPAWDMLLDLFAARLERRPVSVSSLCIAAAVPATTALRWIKMMTESGMFLRTDDAQDGRRIFVELSDDTARSMAQYFEKLDSL